MDRGTTQAVEVVMFGRMSLSGADSLGLKPGKPRYDDGDPGRTSATKSWGIPGGGAEEVETSLHPVAQTRGVA